MQRKQLAGLLAALISLACSAEIGADTSSFDEPLGSSDEALATAPTLRAMLTSKWSNGKKLSAAGAQYAVCAGEPFAFAFTFKNSGSAVWRDVLGRGSTLGSDVFLVTANGQTDELTGNKRFSLTKNLNAFVRGDRNAGNCNSQNGCRKTTFIHGAISATAPDAPGTYATRWRLRDYSALHGATSVGFGPQVELDFQVEDCSAQNCGCWVTCSDGTVHKIAAEGGSEWCAEVGNTMCLPATEVSHEYKACSLTDGGGGSAGAGSQPQCPPSVPAPSGRRFDTVTLNCSSLDTGVCSGNEDKCFCAEDLAALNGSPAHYMAVGGGAHIPTIVGAGNAPVLYVDAMNTNWKVVGGAGRAAQVIESAKKAFPCGVPKWIIANEVWKSQWPFNSAYRQFVIDFAKALKNTYGKNVIVTAPFARPGRNAASWSELQKYAFIGAQVYLSGKEVNANGNSVSWCKKQYQASVDAYAKLGVPKSRLYLFEHFANSLGDVGWGRAGVSKEGWITAIKVRSQAIRELGFAGFASYGWAGNQMHAPEADRLEFMQLYAQQNLP